MLLETLNASLLFAWYAVWPWSVLAAVLLCAAVIFGLVWHLNRRRAQAMAETVLRMMDHGAAVVREDGRICFSNPAFLALLDDPEDEHGQQGPSGMTEVRDTLRMILSSCKASSKTRAHHVLPGGRALDVTVTGFGNGTHLLILRDISAESAAAAAIAEEVEALEQELNRSHRELENFTHVASHDLKEPLRGLTINANFLMREDDLSDVGKDRVNRMISLCHRMEQLISDLLFFSRLSRSGTALEDIDPAQIISSLRVSLTELLDERSGTISVATELPQVHAETAKIKTVFQNLIVNGIKYNDALRKVVTIGFKSSVEVGDSVHRDMFYVSDNGIGIAESNHDKIFGIFSRLNSEKAYGAGTGAGLAFVKKIVEDYGGEITFVSTPGQGTTFYFTLPIARQSGASTLRPVQRAVG